MNRLTRCSWPALLLLCYWSFLTRDMGFPNLAALASHAFWLLLTMKVSRKLTPAVRPIPLWKPGPSRLWGPTPLRQALSIGAASLVFLSGLQVLGAALQAGAGMISDPALQAALLSGGPVPQAEGLSAAKLVMLLITAPLLEEALFRGVLIPAFREAAPDSKTLTWGTFALSACLWASMHQAPGWQLICIAALGVGFAVLAEAEGALWPGVVIHFQINAWSVSSQLGFAEFDPTTAQWAALGLFCAVGWAAAVRIPVRPPEPDPLFGP